jgi:Arc/MetJ-type ribon-helix-helix transcriptional regulator
MPKLKSEVPMRPVTVRLPDQLIQRMTARQRAVGVSASEQVRRALELWLKTVEGARKSSKEGK